MIEIYRGSHAPYYPPYTVDFQKGTGQKGTEKA